MAHGAKRWWCARRGTAQALFHSCTLAGRPELCSHHRDVAVKVVTHIERSTSTTWIEHADLDHFSFPPSCIQYADLELGSALRPNGSRLSCGALKRDSFRSEERRVGK